MASLEMFVAVLCRVDAVLLTPCLRRDLEPVVDRFVQAVLQPLDIYLPHALCCVPCTRSPSHAKTASAVSHSSFQPASLPMWLQRRSLADSTHRFRCGYLTYTSISRADFETSRAACCCAAVATNRPGSRGTRSACSRGCPMSCCCISSPISRRARREAPSCPVPTLRITDVTYSDATDRLTVISCDGQCAKECHG